jgi:UDP-N-acetylglucosamine 2-epimerase (non-hydrolysing)
LKIDLIAGARPNFVKIAPIINAIREAQSAGKNFQFRLVHTGQHYDKNMSDSFFEQLEIPQPDVNLGAGGGTQAEQTAAIMIGYEQLLLKEKADLCLVVGDVTSTMACAIVAQKLHIPVAHVEAGIRSNDWTMPEEINRLVTDAITNYFFTTTPEATQQILKTGVDKDRVFWVGNTMIDSLLKHRSRFRKPKFWDVLELSKGKYIVMTMHRPSNVDQEENLRSLINEIVNNSHGFPLIFPVHPRTAKVLEGLAIDHSQLYAVEPLGYLEFNYLVENSLAVITDSGGITEETTVLGIPCITLRNNTERPETVQLGTNELIGTDPRAIKPALDKLFAGEWKKGTIPELWDGSAAKRILAVLNNLKVVSKSS